MIKAHLLLALAVIFMATSCNDSLHDATETCRETPLQADWSEVVSKFACEKDAQAWKSCREEIGQNRAPNVDFIQKLEAAWEIHGQGASLANVFAD
jgi:hypothetical protein